MTIRQNSKILSKRATTTNSTGGFHIKKPTGKICIYKGCKQWATHTLNPKWLLLSYCDFHFSIVSRSLNKQNQLTGAHKTLEIEYAETLRQFVESCEGIVGTLIELHTLYIKNSHRDKSLDNFELFAKVFSKLNVPYSSYRKGHLYVYHCTSPCLFKNDDVADESNS